MASETSAQSVQAQFEAANEQFNALQRELSTFITARQQLEAQLQENKIVQEVCESNRSNGNVFSNARNFHSCLMTQKYTS